MKRTWIWLATAALATTFAAFGQNPGVGRGGAPHAWGDKNKDGICDITGKPVGQGRAQMMARGRGRGMQGRGMCRYCTGTAANQPAQPPAPPAKQ